MLNPAAIAACLKPTATASAPLRARRRAPLRPPGGRRTRAPHARTPRAAARTHQMPRLTAWPAPAAGCLPAGVPPQRPRARHPPLFRSYVHPSAPGSELAARLSTRSQPRAQRAQPLRCRPPRPGMRQLAAPAGQTAACVPPCSCAHARATHPCCARAPSRPAAWELSNIAGSRPVGLRLAAASSPLWHARHTLPAAAAIPRGGVTLTPDLLEVRRPRSTNPVSPTT